MQADLCQPLYTLVSNMANRKSRFGPFEVDPEAGELRKHGLRIRLQKQPFEILNALLNRPNEVVTREELRQRIWGSDTVVDFEHGLNAAMNKLRQALADSPDNPRYIETVAGVGTVCWYRLNRSHNPRLQETPASTGGQLASPFRNLWKRGVLPFSMLVVGVLCGWSLRPASFASPRRLFKFSVSLPEGFSSESQGPARISPCLRMVPNCPFVVSDASRSQLGSMISPHLRAGRSGRIVMSAVSCGRLTAHRCTLTNAIQSVRSRSTAMLRKPSANFLCGRRGWDYFDRATRLLCIRELEHLPSREQGELPKSFITCPIDGRSLSPAITF